MKSITDYVEQLRTELYKLYESEESVQSEKILEKSRELDELIVLAQKEKK